MIREIWMNIFNTRYNSSEDMIDKPQSLKGKTKLNFYKNTNNYYNETKNKNFQTQQDFFAKNAQGIYKIYHEVLLLMKFLQTKPQIENMNINYYDLHYTVIKTRGHNNDNNEIDFINFNDFITPNHYIGIKICETILR